MTKLSFSPSQRGAITIKEGLCKKCGLKCSCYLSEGDEKYGKITRTAYFIAFESNGKDKNFPIKTTQRHLVVATSGEKGGIYSGHVQSIWYASSGYTFYAKTFDEGETIYTSSDAALYSIWNKERYPYSTRFFVADYNTQTFPLAIVQPFSGHVEQRFNPKEPRGEVFGISFMEIQSLLRMIVNEKIDSDLRKSEIIEVDYLL